MARAPTPPIDTATLLAHFRALPDFDRLRSADPAFAEAADDTLEAIFDEAAAFAADRLDPLSLDGERNPPRWENGKVVTSALHGEIWRDYAQAGWLTLDLPENVGGQGLPLAVAVAVQEIFDRHSAAFGMMAVSGRSAARLIRAWAAPDVAAEWVPNLLSGEWAATICISETGAGSDAMRMTTTGRQDADGNWLITGEKHWISFGSHDLTSRIGHCLLARTQGQKGLSLFLVPDRLEDGSSNGVMIRSIEDKLGLHLSPTCAMGFEDAQANLLGEEGRGLAQMFTMITNMRISTGAMGLGIASGPADIALAYAQERRQGGRGPQPVPIADHADVQRQLLDMHGRLELTRGLIYHACVIADLARVKDDAQLAALTQFLLPIVKTLGGEVAFGTADAAIQILGGAGYTADWPVEQALRDARVLSVFEGTTGIQALDMLHRRLWKDEAAGLDAMLVDADRLLVAEQDIDAAAAARAVFAATKDCADTLRRQTDTPVEAEAGATAFLDLAMHAALVWTALRLLAATGGDPHTQRLQALARFYLDTAPSTARLHADRALTGAARLSAFNTLLPA